VVPFVLIAIAFIQEATQAIGKVDIAAKSSTGLARVQRAGCGRSGRAWAITWEVSKTP
jgi:biotin-(acetyl-CoA carboxylase) ligase